MRGLLVSSAIALIGLMGYATAQEQAAESLPLEGIAAIVNDSPISYSDVRERARLMLLTLGGTQPSQEQINQITTQALEDLINEQLQLQKAQEYEVEIAQEEIASAVENMANSTGTNRDTLNAQLLQAGINPTSLEDQMRAEIAWDRIMSGLYGSRIRISENQVEDQMDRLRTASQTTRYQLSEIFLYAPDSETQTQALQAAETIKSQLDQGADFRVAAQRLSSAPTAATGGDMGWVTLDDLMPELSAAVSALDGPGYTSPITVNNGVYLLAVRNRQMPSESTTKVDLVRLITNATSDEKLRQAQETVKDCDGAKTFANENSELRAAELDGIDVNDLGPEGRSLVMSAPIGGSTDIFAASGGLALMFVCSREENADALPTRDAIKNNLKSRELNMISDRELRDLRREATIIYR